MGDVPAIGSQGLSGFTGLSENQPPVTANLSPNTPNGQFDVFEWFPAYQSCQKYFLDVAQFDPAIQAVAALINIRLPFQWREHPVTSSGANLSSPLASQTQPSRYTESRNPSPRNWVSLVPFMRRLVVTNFDQDSVLHGFFGDDWRKGVGPTHELERRNYLFAAKSGGWAAVKSAYDMGPDETVPFLQPPHNLKAVEVENAEKLWSEWLWLEDWMVSEHQ